MSKRLPAILAAITVLVAAFSDRASGQICADFGIPGDIPVTGDWNGDGRDQVGIFRPGLGQGEFRVDYNGNGIWDPGIDRVWGFGSGSDIPVVGDWNGDGRDEIGIHRDDEGLWNFKLDYNGNGTWDGCGTDLCTKFGLDSDQPVIGDWNGDGQDQIGIFRPWWWKIDLSGNFAWEGPPADRATIFGIDGDLGVPGDWDGDGRDEIAIYRQTTWKLDLNDNGVWDGLGPDGAFIFGSAGHLPVVGDWDGDGRDTAGTFSDGDWYCAPGISQPPVAVDDEATTAANTPLLINVVANDHDPHLLPLSLATSPNPVVLSPSNGTATRHNDQFIRYTPNVGFSGVDSFVYRVTATDQETAEATVTVTVTSAPAPDITLVNRRTIPLGGQTTIKIRGRNMANAVVRIPDPDDESKVAPAVVSIDHVPVNEQHRFDIVLDTSNPATEGFFVIVIENEAGLEAAAAEDLRVVPNRPVVDLYTPSVAVEGAAYFMMAAGANLLTASATTSHPNISIEDLDNSDDSMLTGLLVVESGAAPGNFTLTLGVPGGGTIDLPIELPAEPDTPTGTMITELAGDEGQGLPVYLQEPTFFGLGSQPLNPPSKKSASLKPNPVSKQASLVENISGEQFGCQFPDTFFRLRGSSNNFEVRVQPLDSSGMVNPAVLSNMEVGEVRRLGAGAFSVLGIISILIEVGFCNNEPGLFFEACAVINAGVEPLGGPGQITTSIACTNGTGFTQTELTNGTLDFFQFTSPRQCTDIQTAVGPPPPGGQFATDIELTQCCAETIDYSTGGIAFQTSGFARSYSELGRPLAAATPTCGTDVFDVEIRAFIPPNHLTTPLSCSGIAGPQFTKGLVAPGDDRGFDANPPLSVTLTNRFRVEHTVSVMPSAADCSASGICTSEGQVAGSRRTRTGKSELFAEDALDNPPVGFITAADFDGQLEDCFRWHLSGVPQPGTDELVVERIDSDSVKVSSFMAVSDPLVLLSPDLDWGFSLTINADGTYDIEGAHDCYPSYEVYINDNLVWGFMTTNNSFENLACCLNGAFPLIGFCSGTISSGVPCVVVQSSGCF